MTTVTAYRQLDALPYDIVYQIVSQLDCFDFNHLARVNRWCYAILQNDYLAKRSIKVCASGSQACVAVPVGPLRR